MTEQSNSLSKTQAVWSQVRAFGALWLALTCIGGFVVLIGGPWVLGLLSKILGPAAAMPGRVITLDAIFMLPFAAYFFYEQRKLNAGSVACSQCGGEYPKTSASCPKCGCVNPEEHAKNEQTTGDIPAAKS